MRKSAEVKCPEATAAALAPDTDDTFAALSDPARDILADVCDLQPDATKLLVSAQIPVAAALGLTVSRFTALRKPAGGVRVHV